MSATQSVVCPVHGLELTAGSMIYMSGTRVRPHLICPVPGCTILNGSLCPKCGSVIVRTYRDPRRDKGTANPAVIFEAWICPACDYNAYEVDGRASVTASSSIPLPFAPKQWSSIFPVAPAPAAGVPLDHMALAEYVELHWADYGAKSGPGYQLEF